MSSSYIYTFSISRAVRNLLTFQHYLTTFAAYYSLLNNMIGKKGIIDIAVPVIYSFPSCVKPHGAPDAHFARDDVTSLLISRSQDDPPIFLPITEESPFVRSPHGPLTWRMRWCDVSSRILDASGFPSGAEKEEGEIRFFHRSRLPNDREAHNNRGDCIIAGRDISRRYNRSPSRRRLAAVPIRPYSSILDVINERELRPQLVPSCNPPGRK